MRRSMLVIAGAVSCGLFPDLSDLTISEDASTLDAPSESAVEAGPADAAADVTDASVCAPITRVAHASSSPTSVTASVSVTMNVTQGDLLVAALGAQFGGALAISDNANNTWTSLVGAENLSCVTDAAPWGSRARIAYTTVAATVTNDDITFTSTIADYLALTVAEYSSTGAIVFTTSGEKIPDAASSTLALSPLTTTGCTNVVVAIVADEDPGNDTWTPFAGFGVLATDDNWSFVAIDDVDAAAGSIVAGASHPTSDNCWAVAGAAFSAQ